MAHSPSACPPLVIRADASVSRGTGHVMRMLALAQAWQRRGGESHLLGRELPETLVARLKAEPVTIHQLPDSVAETRPGSLEADAEATIDLARRLEAPWIVADGYHFEVPFQATIRKAGFRLAMVTDFDYCSPWTCDLIVNQNPHSIAEAYESTVETCQRMLGTRFALMRSEFQCIKWESVHASSSRLGKPRLLITLGGSDPPNATSLILANLMKFTHQPLEIRVLVGAANPHVNMLVEQIRAASDEITLIQSASDMPAQYQWADAIISAGGSSCWEWMYFGLNAGILVIADNQRPIYHELTGNGSAIGLGGLNRRDADATDADAKIVIDYERFMQFISQIGETERDPTRFRDQVDGYGADRFAAMLDPTGIKPNENSAGVWLRRAASTDRQLYFDWANDPVVREQSLQTASISWSEHCDWFAHQLDRPDVYLLVAMSEESAIAQIRFTLRDSEEWEVAFSVGESSRGKGVGSRLLQLGIAWMLHQGHSRFLATVKSDNPASARCFERLGWVLKTDEVTGLITFRHDASSSDLAQGEPLSRIDSTVGRP